MPNPHEASARRAKAERLAAHLHEHGITAQECRSKFTQDTWKVVARVIGVRRPSEQTQALVIEILEEMKGGGSV